MEVNNKHNLLIDRLTQFNDVIYIYVSRGCELEHEPGVIIKSPLLDRLRKPDSVNYTVVLSDNTVNDRSVVHKVIANIEAFKEILKRENEAEGGKSIKINYHVTNLGVFAKDALDRHTDAYKFLTNSELIFMRDPYTRKR